ncbi:MAG: hypothetical protein K8I27_00410 [Planctomycetes bacterium]|nr:hypothetical protein [Planctomycetota bacterium]
MRTLMMMILALAVAAPAFAQEAEKPKEDKPVEKPDDGEVKKREMTEEGKLLFADVEKVYAKYYEILLAKFKDNETYKTDDVWNEAVKEAKNGKYKDGKEFHDAITNMKRTDRVFKKAVQDHTTKSAEDFAEAVEKWTKEQKK